MGCCNELVSALDSAAFEPSQHVNFAKGMVLGVEDFRQEFAYLSGRDQWLVRDAIGYGTASGLRVFVESDGSEGLRLHITAGSAFVPSGKHVCVPADQCAVINRWLAKPGNAAIVNQLLNPVSPPLSPPLSPPSPPLSPPAVSSGTIALFLTLCYADCLTRPVPVPGEPCRSDDELMADSRVADDFRLELRSTAPAQVEEDALRDFVRWLRSNVEIVDTSPPPAASDAAWLEALRPAAQPWFDAMNLSPPASPPISPAISPPTSPPLSPSFATLGDYLFDLSPLNLTVGQEQMCEFLRVAFRFWVTELRPMWMARRCHAPVVKDQDCILLARFEFHVEWIGGSPSGAWQIVGSPASVLVDETTRPFLVHQRLLQEWMLCGCDCAGFGAAPAMGEVTPIAAPVAPAFANVAARMPILKTSSDVVLDASHYCIVCSGASPIKLTLPASLPLSAGRVYIIKNIDVTKLTLIVDAIAGDLIDDKTSLALKKKKTVTLIADGAGAWQVIGMVE